MPSAAHSPELDYRRRRIRAAVAGIGNCAGSLIQGVSFYRDNPNCTSGLLFPQLAGYQVSDIEFVAGFDISQEKVGKPLSDAILARPNNFVPIPGVAGECEAPVFRAPTMDGNRAHLAQFVPESSEKSRRRGRNPPGYIIRSPG